MTLVFYFFNSRQMIGTLNPPLTFPSLSGTFGIPTGLILNPKMPKEPSSPSHSNALTADPDKTKIGGKLIQKWLRMKEAQCLTCGIFYCRDRAVINGCGSLQTSSWLESDVLRNRQQKHTAIRYRQAKKNTI